MGFSPELPRRMFAIGEEPVGIRVTSYGPSSGIRAVLAVLGDEEKAIIQRSSFGKFISIAEQPAYSGRFGRFIISRLLKVTKKHEIWVLFAGKPVRFSLREFAIVTGLPCGKYPKKSKTRLINNINSTPYWPKLFGKVDSISVAAVIKMLKRKTVKDQETRIKYACLALLASVLMPTTHHPKIVKEHVEEIEDLNSFFMYPWGRLAFQMLIGSIKEKNEITLSQNTIALKGFVHALQLVMVEAVPALLEIVQVNSTSASESEGEGDKDDKKKTVSLSPGHARDLHEEEKTIVDCIIPGDGETELDERELGWSEDEDDEKVDRMVGLINEDYSFCSSMFVGGATAADVDCMIKEAKDKNPKGKEKKGQQNTEVGKRIDGVAGVASQVVDYEKVADIVAGKLKLDIHRLEAKLNDNCHKLDRLEVKVNDNFHKLEEVKPAMSLMETDIILEVTQQIVKMKSAVIDSMRNCFEISANPNVHQISHNQRSKINSPCNKEGQVEVSADNIRQKQDVGYEGGGYPNVGNCSEVGDNTIPLDGVANDNVDDVNAARHELTDVRCQIAKDNSCPAFSLGLSQEEGGRLHDKRFSKRQKTVITSPLDDYQCDKRMLQRVRESLFAPGFEEIVDEYSSKFRKLLEKIKNVQNLTFGGVHVGTKEFIDVCGRTKFMQAKMMDVLIHHTRSLLIKQGLQLARKTNFLESKFVPSLLKNYTKFARMGNKNAHQFHHNVLDLFADENWKNTVADRFYFPFNFNQTHWVGICVDCTASTIYILDSDVSLRTDTVIAKELAPIAQLVPYLFRQVRRYDLEREPKPFMIVRPKTVPQNAKHVDSGVTAVLLMQAHAIGGLEICGCITADVLTYEAQLLAVTIYESNYDLL